MFTPVDIVDFHWESSDRKSLEWSRMLVVVVIVVTVGQVQVCDMGSRKENRKL